jgi:hypothetical protein
MGKRSISAEFWAAFAVTFVLAFSIGLSIFGCSSVTAPDGAKLRAIGPATAVHCPVHAAKSAVAVSDELNDDSQMNTGELDSGLLAPGCSMAKGSSPSEGFYNLLTYPIRAAASALGGLAAP